MGNIVKKSNEQLVASLIQEHPCAMLGTVSEGGEVCLANVYIHVNDSLEIFFVTRPNTRKFAHVIDHPRVTLLFRDQSSLTQAEFIGTAEAITETAVIAELLPKLRNLMRAKCTSSWIPPVGQIEGSQYAFIKIKPREIIYREYTTEKTKQKKQEVRLVFGKSGLSK